MVNLQHLNLSGNDIDDLTPIVGLVQLEILNLNRNKIVDIQPLLDNIGIGAGDEIQLKANKLSDISRNQHVPALEARGVIGQVVSHLFLSDLQLGGGKMRRAIVGFIIGVVCLFSSGCVGSMTHGYTHPHSEITAPAFCFYDGRPHTQR